MQQWPSCGGVLVRLAYPSAQNKKAQEHSSTLATLHSCTNFYFIDLLYLR
jgi:hypothetical protein